MNAKTSPQENTSAALRAEKLMTHMRALCQIGPRPSTSAKERQAADYVKKTLADLGLTNVQEQLFKSQTTVGWILVTVPLVGLLAILLAWVAGSPGKLVAGIVLLVGAFVATQTMRASPVFFRRLIERGASQNLIARVAPSGTTRRTVYLVGHLDTNKQRFLAPPSAPSLMKPLVTFTLLMPVLFGVSLLADVVFNRQGFVWWQWALSVEIVISAVLTSFDETQPHIEGANDNTTAVSTLLGMAEVLKDQPLEHTEVVLLFTGCEEVVCVGMESYLRELQPPHENTYWVDLEMIGTGNICYITGHGISYLTQYKPAPDMVELAAKAARKNPDLGVVGRNMLILEEVSNLRAHDYRAICIAGYDQKGFLPNWHRVSDNLSHIEPETLSRGARFTWALMREIDQLTE